MWDLWKQMTEEAKLAATMSEHFNSCGVLNGSDAELSLLTKQENVRSQNQ